MLLLYGFATSHCSVVLKLKGVSPLPDQTNLLSWSQILLALLPALFGGGIILAIFKYFTTWRKNHRIFDLKMDEFIKSNRQLNKNIISYVNRVPLNNRINDFLKNNYITCVILGPAGSGKTRFAQHIIRRNRLFSKFRFVYINDKNGKFFMSDDFKNNYDIHGKRRYVFIFDYYYENIFAINNLADKATRNGRHKFIFVERDYGWESMRILDRPEYTILMTEYSMDTDMLAEVFCNQVILLNGKRKKALLKQRALNYGKVIIEKIDPNFRRPIFSQLIAQIYLQNKDFSLNNIEDSAQLISSYWYNKFDSLKINSICPNIDNNVFNNQLDILSRIIVIAASITKQTVRIRQSGPLTFQLQGANLIELDPIIRSTLTNDFIDTLNNASIRSLVQLFGVVLKNLVKYDKSADFFDVSPELDLIVDWIMYDSLKSTNIRDQDAHWLIGLTGSLSNAYLENYISFVRRGCRNFDLIVLLEKPYCGGNYETVAEIICSYIDEAFLADSYEKYIVFMQNLISAIKANHDNSEFYRISTKYLLKIKECYSNNKKQDLVERLQSLIEYPLDLEEVISV